MAKAEQLFAELEAWYNQHPEASFEEIEREVRNARRKMMGSALGIVVNETWGPDSKLSFGGLRATTNFCSSDGSMKLTIVV